MGDIHPSMNRELLYMVNEKRLTDEFLRLTAIDAESGDEAAMRAYLTGALAKLGIRAEADAAGNLFARLPGTRPGEALLFSAHMDTVRPGRGKRAVVRPDGRITSDGTTVLGADDAAGLAAILEALTVIRERALPHPDLELLFTAAEEVYGVGSARFDYAGLRAKTAYVLDLTGPVGTAAVAAPTLLALDVTVRGRAAHAGFAPEAGVNALSIAAAALAQLHTGRVEADTTVNFGTIEGGTGQNIVPAQIRITGEVRSLRHEAALLQASVIEDAFRREAERLGGEVEVAVTEKIRAYRTAPDAPAVRRLRAALAALGRGEPSLVETFGGSDNNVFALHDLWGVVLAAAMELVHTTEEYTEIAELTRSAELTLKLMTLEETP